MNTEPNTDDKRQRLDVFTKSLGIENISIK
jgi:hypothetical protein